MDSMFCFQCQETFKNTGCIKVGVCGKNPVVAGLQDFLIWATKKLSIVTTSMREHGMKVTKEVNHLVTTNLFVTITNANFDPDAIEKKNTLTLETIAALRKEAKLEADAEIDALIGADTSARLAKALTIGILQTKDEDKRALKELIIYGLKGLCAYMKHANILKHENEEVDAFIQKTLSVLIDEELCAHTENGRIRCKGNGFTGQCQ